MHLSFYLRCGVLLLGMILATTITYAQSGFFEPLSSTQARVATTKDGPQPERSALYRLKTGELRTYLAKAPLEFRSSAAPLRLAIPLPNGTVETFGILESPILSPALSAVHRDIKTYTGRGLANPTYMIRLSLTSSGFDAIILGVENDAVYYTKTSDNPTSEVYMTYFARDAKRASAAAQPFGVRAKCGIESTTLDVKTFPQEQARLANNTGTMLRTFRLAVAATGEFTQRKGGGNVNTAYNALVAYVNRMNAVYRVELSVAFQLVSGTNIVYPNPNTDPYDNSEQKQMLTENQTNLDAVIKPENYDIGHVFGAARGSGGGIAAKGSVCNATQKGKGVSGVGDGSFAAVFDDQLITHEVGHQFGMDHTFNSSIPVCTTREVTTSVEPGAGATIMSYGFTCGADDYESPAYQPFLNFHTVSYQQAVEFLANVSCGLSTATNNAVPAIAQFPANTTIPRSTPFELRATATDANANDVLSYSWEGTNIGNSDDTTASTFTNTAKPPFFRSYPPVSTGARLFPRLEAILNGSNNAPGDKLPSVGIPTTHRLTVRDGAGGLTYQTVTVTVDGNSGPFLVTSNLNGFYTGGSQQTINWDVANTTAAPVNCANVNIQLSTDGGRTFPTTLLANTPNDGTETITFPNITNNQCRIRVIAANNIFFDISNSNFTVLDPNNQPPVAAAIPNQAGTLDVAFNYTVPAFTDPENQELSYRAIGLPASLSMNAGTRVISGTPSAVGPFSVSVIATDPGNATALSMFTLTINPGPVVPLVASLSANATTVPTTGAIILTSTASGGRPPYLFAFDYPDGRIVFTPTSATITGMSAGVKTLTVVVTDNTLPASQTVISTVVVTVTEPGSVPMVRVNSNDPSAAEGRPATAQNTGMQAKISRLASADEELPEDFGYIQFERTNTVGPLVVNYQIGGSATNGADFEALPTSITFADGQSVYTEIIDPIDDDIVEGDETIIITLIDTDDYDPDPNQITTTVTLKDNDTPVPPAPTSLTITSFTCNGSTNATLNRVDFVVGYANGAITPAVAPLFINGVTGNGSLGVRYSLPFDQNVNSLTVQDLATRSTYFVWNFRAACTGTPTPPQPPTPPTPPVPGNSLTITSFTCNGSTNATLSRVDFVLGYPNGTFTPAVAPIFINGVTANGSLGVRYSLPFDQNVNSLTVQDLATRSTYFVWNFRAACTGTPTPPQPPTPPTPPVPGNSLTITSFTCNGSTNATLSRVDFVVGYPNGTFTPAVAPIFINGVTGNGSLGVRYSLPFDQNVNSLTVQDQATRSTYFVWNFRQACLRAVAREGAESITPWHVSVEGNPTKGEIVMLIEGAQRQTLTVEVLDLTGRSLQRRVVQPGSAKHRERFDVTGQSAGLLLLRTASDTYMQTVKVIKE